MASFDTRQCFNQIRLMDTRSIWPAGRQPLLIGNNGASVYASVKEPPIGGYNPNHWGFSTARVLLRYLAVAVSDETSGSFDELAAD